MIFITNNVSLNDNEVDISAIRAQGAGGQNVNKVSSAIHLRFDINDSSLSDNYKQRLLDTKDGRITKEGILILKAQQHRTQERNKIDAFNRLKSFIKQGIYVEKARKATRPSRTANRKRVDAKTQRGRTKALRGKVDY
jgi:ribosome-associated protein